AATFSSADSVLTTLTTSFYIDMLHLNENPKLSERKKQMIRTGIHIVFTILIWVVILMYQVMNNQAIVDTILMLAGYTYGPLLAMFGIGIFSKKKISSNTLITASFLAPLILYFLSQTEVPYGYKLGNEIIIWNALLVVIL